MSIKDKQEEAAKPTVEEAAKPTVEEAEVALEEARKAKLAELSASIKKHAAAIAAAEAEKAKLFEEQIQTELDENAVMVTVKNTTDSPIGGIQAGKIGEVTYGYLKGAVGLVEV